MLLDKAGRAIPVLVRRRNTTRHSRYFYDAVLVVFHPVQPNCAENYDTSFKVILSSDASGLGNISLLS